MFEYLNKNTSVLNNDLLYPLKISGTTKFNFVVFGNLS